MTNYARHPTFYCIRSVTALERWWEFDGLGRANSLRGLKEHPPRVMKLCTMHNVDEVCLRMWHNEFSTEKELC